MLLEKYRYIVVEGPIGAGKTSLATRLAEKLRAGLLLEDAGENPFLAKFYQEGKRHAYQHSCSSCFSASIRYAT
jgi:deoxyguanosine kinase